MAESTDLAALAAVAYHDTQSTAGERLVLDAANEIVLLRAQVAAARTAALRAHDNLMARLNGGGGRAAGLDALADLRCIVDALGAAVEVPGDTPPPDAATALGVTQMKAAAVQCCRAGRVAYPDPCPWHSLAPRLLRWPCGCTQDPLGSVGEYLSRCDAHSRCLRKSGDG